jgi:polyhydroxyalkanoate synthesis regulator phasin
MENFENLFKNLFYSGIGIISLTADKIQQLVDELIKDKKISTQEGERIVKDFLKSSDEKKKEYEEEFKKIVEKVISKFPFATKKEVEELKAQIEKLEKQINKEKE